ncbi:MAG: tripartite tricarboxylate transporter substrate binding protein [Pigmentiphaga sp.]|nr:tripartite tricarboxylate transporter substrate binding protein [Pigmentiphaga sp.]
MQLARSCLGALVGILGCTAIAVAADTSYPRQPVTVIVQFPPGGVPDTMGRLLAQNLSKQLGQPFIVENRTGAAGNIGTEAAARATPDGYTLLFAADAPMVINPAVYASLPFDPVADFEPITLAAEAAFALLAGPAFKGKNVQDLIEQAKANPGAINFGSSGIGSSHHLAGELFNTLAGVDINHVPYRGFGPGSVDVMGGQLEVMYGSVPASRPLVDAGKLRALAVTGSSRSSGMPDVPTMIEAGLPNYDVTAWFGLMAPAGTPPAILEQLNQATQRALDTEELREASAKQGLTLVVGVGPEDFAKRIQSDLAKWQEVVKSANITVQ